MPLLSWKTHPQLSLPWLSMTDIFLVISFCNCQWQGFDKVYINANLYIYLWTLIILVQWYLKIILKMSTLNNCNKSAVLLSNMLIFVSHIQFQLSLKIRLIIAWSGNSYIHLSQLEYNQTSNERTSVFSSHLLFVFHCSNTTQKVTSLIWSVFTEPKTLNFIYRFHNVY